MTSVSPSHLFILGFVRWISPSGFKIMIFPCYKESLSLKNESLVLDQVTKPGLKVKRKCPSHLPRDVVWTVSQAFPGQHQWGNLSNGPSPSARMRCDLHDKAPCTWWGTVTLPETSPYFLFLITSCPTLFPVKTFHFAQFLRASLLTR